jgi:ABC-type glycerol-3-phosphate transport system permease component
MELIRFIFRLIVRLIAIHIAVYSVAIFGPMLVVVPFILIAKFPTADLTWLALTLFWVAPISAGFYTNLSYHWLSVRQYQQINGTPKGWRDAHGGIWRTGMRSIAIMFGALFASYICEVMFVFAFSRVPFASGLTRELVGFALMPLATFAPVILLLLRGYMQNACGDGALRTLGGL